jgi:hypothetical protein
MESVQAPGDNKGAEKEDASKSSVTLAEEESTLQA